MMDAKYLAEIKARCELGRPAQQREVKALLAEVERLTIENLGLKDAAIRCDGYEKRYHSALTELDVKNQQIATLKRALEIMHEFMSITEVGSRAKREYFTPDYFIQQAQEQEAEK